MKKTEWAKSFATTRLALGLSQEKAAKAVQTATRNVQRWEAGATEPPSASQAGILSTLRKSQQAPSKRKRAAAARTHHIYLDRSKGWVLRCTISRGAKLVGLRQKRVLKTRRLDEAKRRAELIIAEWKTMGLSVCLRMQKSAADKGQRKALNSGSNSEK